MDKKVRDLYLEVENGTNWTIEYIDNETKEKKLDYYVFEFENEDDASTQVINVNDFTNNLIGVGVDTFTVYDWIANAGGHIAVEVVNGDIITDLIDNDINLA